MLRQLIAYIILNLVFGQECDGVNITHVFLDVGERKLINLNTIYSEQDKILQMSHKMDSRDFGFIQDAEIKFSNAVASSFDQLVDMVVLDVDYFTIFTRIALLGIKGGFYEVDVIDVPKYSSAPVQARIVAAQRMFKDEESPTVKQCYSLDFVEINTLVIDCAEETAPEVLENFFFHMKIDSQTMTKESNLNVNQIHTIVSRKMRNVVTPEGIFMIRGHLQVDQQHQNQTYLEVFKYDNVNSQMTLEKYSTIPGLLDFEISSEDIVVMTEKEFLIRPIGKLLSEVDDSKIKNIYKDSQRFTLSETNSDYYRIYVAVNNSIEVYDEQTKAWTNIFKGNQIIDSIYVTKRYLIANQRLTSVVIGLDDGHIHTNTTKRQNEVILSTGTEEEVIKVDQTGLQNGEILPELLVLHPVSPTKEPVELNVFADVNAHAKCIARLTIIVTEPNYQKLHQIKTESKPLTERTSNEIYGMETQSFSDLVIGPDVQFVEAELDGEEDYLISSLDSEASDLEDFNITLGNNSKILQVIHIEESILQVFLLIEEEIVIQECNVVVPDEYFLEDLICQPYPDSELGAKNLTKFYADVCHKTKQTIMGVQKLNELPKFFLLKRTGRAQGSVMQLSVNATGENWRLHHEYLVTYGKGVSDMTIHDFNLRTATFQPALTITQLHFFYLLNLQKVSPWCVATSKHQVFITTESAIMQIDRVQDRWELSDIFPFRFPEILFCVFQHRQLIVGNVLDVQVFGTDPDIYYRGNMSTYGFKMVAAFSSDNYIYIKTTAKVVLQYNMDHDQALSSSLERIIETNATQFVAVSLLGSELVYTKEGEDHLVTVYVNDKQLYLDFDEELNDFIVDVKYNLTFTNYFKQTVHIIKQEQLVCTRQSLTAYETNQTFVIDRKYRASEIYFDPSLMFNGPYNELSIDANPAKYQIRNRISPVANAEVENVVDLAFFKDSDGKIKILVLTSNSVQVMMSDLTMSMKTIPIVQEHKLGTIHVDYASNRTYVVSYGDHQLPQSIFYGDLTLGSDQLSFIQTHLKQDWQRIIKSTFVGQYFVVMYQAFSDTFLKVLKPYKDNVQEVILENVGERAKNMTNPIDFDVHLTDVGMHILILDAVAGVTIFIVDMSVTQVKQFFIRKELISTYKQVLFLDTQFNGIHTIKDQADKHQIIRTFITTNNALQFQINFDVKTNSFTYVGAFMRLGDKFTEGQSISYIPEVNSITVPYKSEDSILVAFYNLSNIDDQSNLGYYQVLEVTEKIGQDYIKPVGTIGNTLNATQLAEPEERPYLEETKWPLQGGFIAADTESVNSTYKMYEIQDLPGVVLVEGNFTGTHQIMIMATGVDYQFAEYPIHLVSREPSNKRPVSSVNVKDEVQVQDQSFKKLMQDDQFISFLFVAGGLASFVVVFMIIRCIRRHILMRSLTRQQEVHEFSSEHL